MGGSAYLDRRPYIAQSERVGSAMQGSRVVTPAEVGGVLEVCESLQVADYEKACKLIKQLSAKFDSEFDSEFAVAPIPSTPVEVEPERPKLAAKTDEALLIGGMQLCAANAGRQASESVMRLNDRAQVYSTGQDTGRAAYESLSQAGYLAAYEVQTYGETCLALGVRPVDQGEMIVAAGHNLFARVQEHEEAYLANALSPSAIFYDDLINVETLLQPHDQATLRYNTGTLSRSDEPTIPTPTD